MSLVKDTMIYGMSSIVGRFLNYWLVLLYTHCISAESGGYGVVTNLYAYTALIMVLLTFGMETTFFRFANKEDEDPQKVFATSLSFVSLLSILFLTAVWTGLTPLSHAMGYASHPEYVLMMAATVALDAIQAIPFCYLRHLNRPLKFVSLKLLFIVLNIGLNLIYFLGMGCSDVWGVFVLNLVCTASITFFFLPELLHIRRLPDPALLRRMFSYSWPILVLGLAGILNQAFDKIIFPWAYTYNGLHTWEEAQKELGIYGACVKVAMIMAMITQAFRYAYEPIVFSKNKDKNSKSYYATTMKYFIIFTLFAFLCVMGYLDI
ncbi:MAG: lipopolysaccharide biosynthesis protein, partial [Bacteroidaceae bacterium]|nr:lipopolysaccharide biosynthesis protein [Bacteroidaceae bacterium]